MKEYPVFVPSGDERIGAVVCVPEGPLRGLVLLLPGGGGAPRSQRFGMFTKIARGLAERDIASVRMEWPGIGDSTGRARYSFKALPVEHSSTVARFAIRATGAPVFGMVGNCGGARTALLALPSVPEATSGVLMMLKPLTGTRSRKRAVRKTKLFVRKIPRIGLAIRRASWALRWRTANPVLDQLRLVSGMSDLLLLEANTVKVGNQLPRFVEGLRGKNGRHRLELREMPGGGVRAFQSIERQEFAIRAVVEWFDQGFPPSPAGGNGSAGGLSAAELIAERERTRS
jgi:hypothetical protein